jgi:uncharacterized protein (DUF1499 family)
MARETKLGDRVGAIGLIAAMAAPVAVLIGAVISRFHLGSYDLGFDLIAVKIGGILSVVASVLALIALFFAFADFRRLGVRALIAVAVAGLTLAGEARFQLQSRDMPPIHDVSTNWDDPVDFSDQLMATRGPTANPVETDPHVPASAGPPWGGQRVATVNAKTCPGAKPVMHGVDPDRAAKALQANGVQVVGSAIFRVEGIYTGFWFGAQDDVAVRIRPERTDVRSVRRSGLSDYGANCARVTRIVQALSR